MLRITDRGLHCPAADLHIDPWLPVDRAVITHAHGDHLRPGSRAYLCSDASVFVVRTRIGGDGNVLPVAYGQPVDMNGVTVSLHPAGHILGSAQVRVEHR